MIGEGLARVNKIAMTGRADCATGCEMVSQAQATRTRCNRPKRRSVPIMKRMVIRGGRVLDIKARSAELADIFIEDGTIRSVASPGGQAPEDAEIVNAADRLLAPGLVNGHTH